MKAAVTVLVFCVAGLLALGMVMLYSSSMVQDGAHFLLMQLVWCGVGLVFCLGALLCDYHWLRKIALPLLVLTAVLLVMVFAPVIGIKAGGARRWVGHGVIRFQPSELAKLALLLALAWYAERYQRQMHTWKRGIVIPGVFISLILALVFVEPDRGTTVLLAAVSGAVLLVAGVRWKYILPPVFLGAAGLAFSLWHDPMRTRRILAWLHPEEHRSGAGYQAYEAMLALGSGGLTGVGLGNGTQKLGFVPERHTDFIFSMIGEELGLIATFFILVAFALIVICGIYIAWHAPDTFGLLLGAGISFLIGLQAFINIGVVTSTLPNKGLPLPFISYGGSSLLMMLTCVGLLLSIARQGRGPGALNGSPAIRTSNSMLGPRDNPFKAAQRTAGRAQRIAIRSQRTPVSAPLPSVTCSLPSVLSATP